jgi:hypothetical protein
LSSLIFGCTSQSEQNEKLAAENVENYGHVWDVVLNEREEAVDVIGCTIATIIDGKITEEQDFFDNLEFFKQLGLSAQ